MTACALYLCFSGSLAVGQEFETLPLPSGHAIEAPVRRVRPLSVPEFMSIFRPLPGNHEVFLIHPRTGRPVMIRFSLPPGLPKKVRFNRHEIEFDYGKIEVEIEFKHNGRVEVEYDD